MTQPYNQAGISLRLRQAAFTALLAGGATLAHGQALPYLSANVTNRAGTYSDVTTGTVISTANFDDANSAVQTIPFNFVYNGTTFTQFTLNTNGFIKLGATAPAAPFFSTYAQDVATGGPLNTETNIILPFNTDLQAGTGTPEYRMAVTGTAGSQVLTIQWKNVSDKARAAAAGSANIDKQYANFSFQVKLYEGTNQIDFVYGTATPNTAATSNANFVAVGIKGSGTANNQVITAIKPSNIPWSQTTFQQGPYVAASNGVNIRSAATITGGVVVPDPGRTFSFSIPVATDVATDIVYGYNQLVVPAGQPATIQALIRNAGTSALSNITATLNVSGANTSPAVTQVVNTLAAGATAVVTFTGVQVPLPGTNTVTVTSTVANDGNSTNNSASMTMVTNATTTSFITPNTPSTSAFGTGNGNEAYFTAKVRFTQARDIVAVNAYIGDAAPTTTQKSTVGETLYGVVLDAATGALLARSANFVVTANAVETIHTFTLTAPFSVPATGGEYLVGMVQIAPASNGALRFFPMGVQAEVPTRPDTFFGGSITNGVPTAPQPSLASPNNMFKFMLEAVTAAPATCPAPTGITATGTATTANVSFTASNGAVSYQIIYGATGFNPTSAGTTSASFTTPNFQLTGLTASTCYDIYVRATCSAANGQSAAAGPFNFCTPCTPPTIQSFPYTEDFNTIGPGQTLPCGITVQDVNADGNTWEASAVAPNASGAPIAVGNGGTGNAMVYVFPDNVTPADDWFFTPALRLTGGSRYRLSFAYRAFSTAFTEGLEVKYGNSASAAGQTTTLYTNANITGAAYRTASNSSTPAVADIAPSTTGLYYVGFHVNSAADQLFLAVDNLNITAVLGTSAALTKAVNVFPNPSANGIFNLEIQGANAREAMSVEVTNVLGQRVYTGSAKDNFRNEVNLSSLPAGLYTLKVKNGSEYTSQQLSIAK